jgi:hypothetical protein
VEGIVGYLGLCQILPNSLAFFSTTLLSYLVNTLWSFQISLGKTTGIHCLSLTEVEFVLTLLISVLSQAQEGAIFLEVSADQTDISWEPDLEYVRELTRPEEFIATHWT